MQEQHKLVLIYECPDCHEVWDDTWDCEVNDDCPKCGKRHLSPIEVKKNFYYEGE